MENNAETVKTLGGFLLGNDFILYTRAHLDTEPFTNEYGIHSCWRLKIGMRIEIHAIPLLRCKMNASHKNEQQFSNELNG